METAEIVRLRAEMNSSAVWRLQKCLETTRARVRLLNFHTKGPNILGGNVKNLFARRLCTPGGYVLYVHHLHRKAVPVQTVRSNTLVNTSVLQKCGTSQVFATNCAAVECSPV